MNIGNTGIVKKSLLNRIAEIKNYSEVFVHEKIFLRRNIGNQCFQGKGEVQKTVTKYFLFQHPEKSFALRKR